MVGLPCSGKSSVTSELGNLLGAKVYCEPEEPEWEECVIQRNLCGRFGAHTWFRSLRTCQLFQASSLAQKGDTVFVDSYLDKLLYFCLGKPGMEWLLHPDDPYFDVARHMAQVDLERLPLADTLIFFDIDYQTWHHFLRIRSRKTEEGLFAHTVFFMQEYLRSGVEFLKKTYGTHVITIKNKFGTSRGTAEMLIPLLSPQQKPSDLSLAAPVCSMDTPPSVLTWS